MVNTVDTEGSNEPELYHHNLYAYLYWQWRGDPYLKVFVDTYNELSDQYLDEIRNLNLPNFYTKSGLWLDYVAKNIYGISRKQVLYAHNLIYRGLNTVTPNVVDPNAARIIKYSTAHTMSDEEFKKVIQWNFYKGDGFCFSIPYLKRRIIRFLNITCSNVIDINDISIQVQDKKFKITILNELANSPFMTLLRDVISNGLINLPFMFNFVLENEING